MSTSILIHENKEGIEKTKKVITEGADHVNVFISTAESVMGRTFDDDFKKDIYKRGIDALLDKVRPDFPFPKTDDDSNLKLLGLDFAELRRCHNLYFRVWTRHPQELLEGQFEVVGIDTLPQIESHRKYTRSKAEEQTYKKAERLCKMLNGLRTEGLLNGHSEHLISDAIPIVHLSTQDGERKFRPLASGIYTAK